ncbi:MAG: acyl-CoA-binding protein [Candidatus Schekmanbacteria bacterium]|nr:acyl-CoA-binding protein [Candidatus Schekmanbacteria bacterium]
MSDLKSQFDLAAKQVTQLPARPDNDALLELYALYKQATEGDASGSRPSLLNPVGRAKYDAWSRLKGTNKDTAMQRYVAVVERLKTR